MSKGPYSYNMVMTGDIADLESFEDEDINSMVVKSVAFDTIGDPTYLDEE